MLGFDSIINQITLLMFKNLLWLAVQVEGAKTVLVYYVLF
jgi:hypothetical protein